MKKSKGQKAKSKSPGQAQIKAHLSALNNNAKATGAMKSKEPSPVNAFPPLVKERAITKETTPAQATVGMEYDHVQDSTGQRRQGLRFQDSVGDILMPGDEFIVSPSEAGVILGPGLQLKPYYDDCKDRVATVTKAGVLSQRKANTFYIDMDLRNYLPYKHDDVVGVITKRSGDQYLVDIGTRDRVTLSKLAFEGATKKNKPELKIGDIVFARLMDLPSDFPFELSCITSSGKAMGHGPLEGGFLFQIPSAAVRILQATKNQGGSDIVRRLGQILPFEITFGVNGYIWVKTRQDLANILIAQTIEAAAVAPLEDHSQLLFNFRSSFESIQGILSSK